MVSQLVRLVVITLLAAALLAGCGTRPVEPEPEPVTLAKDSPAGSLLERAREARQAGELHAAGRYLERALGLQPGAPALYRELVELRLQEGRPEAAEGLALRALRRAPENPRWQSEIWDLIAEARARQGRTAEAMEARQRARELRD